MAERSIYINIVKGVAIFLMIWGHCIQVCALDTFDFFENAVFKVIYSFHMPLFMLVSGYLFQVSFQKRNLKDLIVHRAKPIVWTIIIGGIVIWFCTTCLFEVLRGNYSIIFGGHWVKTFDGLWFLWSILSASIGVAIICKKVTYLWLQIPLLLLWGFVVLLFPNAENNLYMYPYYIIGFYFAKYKEKISSKLMFIKYVTIPLFPIMCLFFEKKHYIYTGGLLGGVYVDGFLNILKMNMFRWAIGLVGSVFVLTIIEVIFKLFIQNSSRGLGKKLFIPLERTGEKSLQIYVLSSIFVSSWLPLLYKKVVDVIGKGNFMAINIWVYNLIYTFLLATIFTIAIYWLIKLLYKLRIGKIIFCK